MELEELANEKMFKANIQIDKMGDPPKILFSTYYVRPSKREVLLVAKLQMIQ